MAYTLNTDVETLSRRLTEGLDKELELAIRERLWAEADAIVSAIAREMAHNIRGKIQMYHDIPDDRVQVSVVFDRGSVLVKPGNAA